MPYCANCGKEVDASKGTLCDECRRKVSVFGERENPYEAQVYKPQNATAQPYMRQEVAFIKPGNRKEGFKKALASTVLGGDCVCSFDNRL